MGRLTGPEHFALMGLRRVRRGGVARAGDHYVEGGVLIPGCLFPIVFGGLIEDGLVAVAAPDPESGLARLSLTEPGQARYLHLIRTQRGLPTPPPERHAQRGAGPRSRAGAGAGQRPAGRRSARRDGPAGDQPGPTGPESAPPGWWTR